MEDKIQSNNYDPEDIPSFSLLRSAPLSPQDALPIKISKTEPPQQNEECDVKPAGEFIHIDDSEIELQASQERMLSKQTKNTRIRLLNEFLEFCRNSIDHPKQACIENFRSFIRSAVSSKSDVRKKADSMRTYTSHLYAALENDPRFKMKFSEDQKSATYKYIQTKMKKESVTKAAPFTPENFVTLMKLPNEQWSTCIRDKVIIILGILTAGRMKELGELVWEDVQYKEKLLVVCLHRTKTGAKEQTFFIPNVMHEIEVYPIIDAYKAVCGIPAQGSMWRRFPAGANKTIAWTAKFSGLKGIPRLVAEQLGLPNPEKFKGHSLRHSTANWLAGENASTFQLQTAGNWSSVKVAESYIGESSSTMLSIASKLSGTSVSNVDVQLPNNPANPLITNLPNPLIPSDKKDLVKSTFTNCSFYGTVSFSF